MNLKYIKPLSPLAKITLFLGAIIAGFIAITSLLSSCATPAILGGVPNTPCGWGTPYGPDGGQCCPTDVGYDLNPMTGNCDFNPPNPAPDPYAETRFKKPDASRPIDAGH